MTHLGEDKSRGLQKIEAVSGSTIRDVIQAHVSGQITGDVHIGDKIYPRSDWEKLNDYLARAAVAYEARMYQALRRFPPPEHPYKVLLAFDLQDSHIFFGRDVAIEELYEKVLSGRLTVLHARSGAGKTSLLNAGLSPRLIEEGRLPVYVRTRAHKEDLTRLIKQAIAPSSLGPWPELLPELSLQEFLGMICAHLRQTQDLVVILDQFEEFLVSLPELDLRLPFIKFLRDCYEDQSLSVRFVIALRRENIWDLDEFQPLIPRILQDRYGLPPMTQVEVEQAITGPISRLRRDVSLEPTLLETLFEHLGQADVELTHLQIVCARLYDSLPQEKQVITLGLYQSLGETEDILTGYLNDTLSELPSDKRVTARNILKELVSSEATNRILSLTALEKQVPRDPSLLEDVLERLVDARLLRREDTTDVKEYELAHTYLAEKIIHWVGQDELENKRVQELLQRELVNWRVHQTLVDADRLDILRTHIRYLSLDNEAQTLLFHSALDQGYDVGFWLEQVADKETAIKQLASCLADNRRLRKKIASDLKSNLKRPLHQPLLSALWATFDSVEGTGRRNVARSLWAFRPWLPMQELLRVASVLWPVWIVQSLPFFAVLILLLLGGSRVWIFLSKERAIPGRWVSIPEGGFVMGSDQKEADLAQSLCREGALDESECSDAEELLWWSGRQTDAWLPAFDIMDNEVTHAQYQQCLGAGVCQAPDGWEYDKSDINKPATELIWAEATVYCQWLGGRLPTEGEWEKAARGPDGNYFPWGNDWDPSKSNLEHAGSASVQTISQYAASDVSYYGVKNMAGNVQEWTASEGLPHFVGEPFTDKALMPDGVDKNKPVVVRGGAWDDERSVGMGSIRWLDSILSRRSTSGFRCVCPTGETCKSPWGWWWIWFGKY